MFHVLPLQKYLSRVLVNSAFLLVCISVVGSSAQATSISNFARWQSMSSLSKTAYTAGVMDGLINPIVEPVDHENFKVRFTACLRDFNIIITEIVEMVDNFYLNKNNWGLTPQEAIRFQLINGHCFHYLHK